MSELPKPTPKEVADNMATIILNPYLPEQERDRQIRATEAKLEIGFGATQEYFLLLPQALMALRGKSVPVSHELEEGKIIEVKKDTE